MSSWLKKTDVIFYIIICFTRTLCIWGAGIVWINQEKIKCANGVCIWFLWCKQGDLLFLHPNTGSTRANIEKSLTHDGMWCLTPHVCWSQSVRNTSDIFSSCIIHWRNIFMCCRPTQGHPCKVKGGKCRHGTPMPTYRGLKKEFHLNNHVSIKFWFCVNDINSCMKGSKKWVIDWANLMTVWLVKVGTNNKPFTWGGHCIGGCRFSTMAMGGLVTML